MSTTPVTSQEAIHSDSHTNATLKTYWTKRKAFFSASSLKYAFVWQAVPRVSARVTPNRYGGPHR